MEEEINVTGLTNSEEKITDTNGNIGNPIILN